MHRRDYKKIAEDTDNYIRNKEFNSQSELIISSLPKNTKHSHETKFKVLDESCIKTVIDLKDSGRLGLMNFASAKNVGGGFLTGANAQEEAIARVSNLSTEQEKFFEEYYQYNRKDNFFGLYSNRMIYSNDIEVFKNDDGEYIKNSTGDKVHPVIVDVMTVPAPNRTVTKKYIGEVSNSDVKDALRERIDNTLRAFANRECKHLILGAFGCGVFGNSPTDVAKIFRQRLSKNGEFYNTFETVTFSVIKGKWSNYDVFKHYFGNEG